MMQVFFCAVFSFLKFIKQPNERKKNGGMCRRIFSSPVDKRDSPCMVSGRDHKGGMDDMDWDLFQIQLKVGRSSCLCWLFQMECP